MALFCSSFMFSDHVNGHDSGPMQGVRPDADGADPPFQSRQRLRSGSFLEASSGETLRGNFAHCNLWMKCQKPETQEFVKESRKGPLG